LQAIERDRSRTMCREPELDAPPMQLPRDAGLISRLCRHQTQHQRTQGQHARQISFSQQRTRQIHRRNLVHPELVCSGGHTGAAPDPGLTRARRIAASATLNGDRRLPPEPKELRMSTTFQTVCSTQLDPVRALETWREAARAVATRWQSFLEAGAGTRASAFASYVAALDAQENAAADLAAVSSSDTA
jgi:hypothetical protein